MTYEKPPATVIVLFVAGVLYYRYCKIKSENTRDFARIACVRRVLTVASIIPRREKNCCRRKNHDKITKRAYYSPKEILYKLCGSTLVAGSALTILTCSSSPACVERQFAQKTKSDDLGASKAKKSMSQAQKNLSKVNKKGMKSIKSFFK